MPVNPLKLPTSTMLTPSNRGIAPDASAPSGPFALLLQVAPKQKPALSQRIAADAQRDGDTAQNLLLTDSKGVDAPPQGSQARLLVADPRGKAVDAPPSLSKGPLHDANLRGHDAQMQDGAFGVSLLRDGRQQKTTTSTLTSGDLQQNEVVARLSLAPVSKLAAMPPPSKSHLQNDAADPREHGQGSLVDLALSHGKKDAEPTGSDLLHIMPIGNFSIQLGDADLAPDRHAPRQTYGFGDLGVFGLDGNNPCAPEAITTSEDLAPPTANTLPPDAQSVLGTPDLQGPVGEDGISVAMDNTRPAKDAVAVVMSPDGTHMTASAAFVSVQHEPSSITGDDETVRGSAAPEKSLPSPSAKPTDAPILVVAGPDDKLVIAARSSQEPGVESAKLRQMIEAAAAEFDMQVGEIHFNGSALSPAAGTKGRQS